MLSPYLKLQIAIQLGKVINTLHISKHIGKAHGHLSSHNVFIELPKSNYSTDLHQLNIKIGEFELQDLAKYANLFSNYRLANVWSSPEVLKQMKKV